MTIKQKRFYYRNENLPSQSSSGSYNASLAFNDFTFLNKKLNNVEKKLSAYDFYKITQVASSKDDFTAKVAALLPNTALIVNSASSFTNDSVTYSSGDIVYKTQDNEITKIVADKGGIYYPKTITENTDGTYSFTYSYLASTPENGETSADFGTGTVASITTPKQTIIIDGFSASPSGSTYAVSCSKPSGTTSTWSAEAAALMISSQPLIPVVKFFKQVNTNYYEEVIISLKAVYNNSSTDPKYTVSSIPSFVDLVLFK